MWQDDVGCVRKLMMVAAPVCCQRPTDLHSFAGKTLPSNVLCVIWLHHLASRLYFHICFTPVPPLTQSVQKSDRERGRAAPLRSKRGYFTELRSKCKGRKCCTANFLWKMSLKTYFSVQFNCYTRLSIARRPPCCFLFQSGWTKAPSTARLAVHDPPGGLLIGPGCCWFSAWAKENPTAFFFCFLWWHQFQ